MLLVILWCPAASSAEARVSPGWPVKRSPLKVKSMLRVRSIRPPSVVRKLSGMEVVT
jgi:hypothetical protein